MFSQNQNQNKNKNQKQSGAEAGSHARFHSRWDMKNLSFYQRGQSLIELVVASSLFIIVAVASVGTFLDAVDSYRKTSSLRTNMDNLNAALESMVRGLGAGYAYRCEPTVPAFPPSSFLRQDCPGGGTYIAFEKVGGNASIPSDQVLYWYDAVKKGIFRSDDGGLTAIAITSPSVEITYMKFFVTGTALYVPDSDTNQPRVTAVIRGSTGFADKTKTDFSIQTTFSQRKIDILAL